MSKQKTWFFGVLFVYAVLCRLLPYALAQFGVSIDPATTWYPWNFSPLMAIALFSGACAANWKWSLAMPLGVMFLSDLGIWALTGEPELFVFRRSQPLIYGCFAAAAAAGLVLRPYRNMLTALPMAIAAETVFFLVTNFMVWYFGEGRNYPMTVAGLGVCYAMGLPFFGRSLVSTSLYTVALFSPAALRLAGVEAVASRNVAASETRA